MKVTLTISSIIIIVLVAACQSEKVDTMVLLDEKVKAVHISESNGLGEINTESFESFTNEKSIKVFEKAIMTAQKQPETVDVSEPEYDVMVEYEAGEGELPTLAIHLWLGGENERSTLMYIEDDEVYLTTPAITKKLTALLIKE